MKGLFYLCLMILICAFPKISFTGALNSLMLCINTLIPSLFPFFVISKMFIKSNSYTAVTKIFSPIMKFLFGTSPQSLIPFILGIVSGYPIGASSVCELYNSKNLTKDEAQNLLGFTNNSGPSFIIGTVGASFLNNVKIGYALYFVHIISSVSTGIFLRKNIKNTGYNAVFKNDKKNKNIFTSAVEESVLSVLSVCGYVVFFAVIIEFVLKFTDNIFIIGFLELTTSVKLVCEKSISLNQKFVIISTLCAFASMSINMQTKKFIDKTDLSFAKYIGAKCIHLVFAFFYSVLYIKIFPFTSLVFSHQNKVTTISKSEHLTFLCVLIFLMYFLLIKKDRKSHTWFAEKNNYSTVTDFARFLGLSTLYPFSTATKYARSWSGTTARTGDKISCVSGIFITIS